VQNEITIPLNTDSEQCKIELMDELKIRDITIGHVTSIKRGLKMDGECGTTLGVSLPHELSRKTIPSEPISVPPDIVNEIIAGDEPKNEDIKEYTE